MIDIIIGVLVLTGLIGFIVKGLRGAGRIAYRGVTGNDPKAAARHAHTAELARLTAERQARKLR